MIRLLVCGGRSYNDLSVLTNALDYVHSCHGIATIIHGACHSGGADELAGGWARMRGITEERYPVDTSLDGPWPAAGNLRNGRMLSQSKPDAGVAFPGGKGTQNMVSRLRAAGLPVWVIKHDT